MSVRLYPCDNSTIAQPYPWHLRLWSLLKFVDTFHFHLKSGKKALVHTCVSTRLNDWKGNHLVGNPQLRNMHVGNPQRTEQPRGESFVMTLSTSQTGVRVEDGGRMFLRNVGNHLHGAKTRKTSVHIFTAVTSFVSHVEWVSTCTEFCILCYSILMGVGWWIRAAANSMVWTEVNELVRPATVFLSKHKSRNYLY